ncbi:hypothetical protein ABFT80_26995 [Mesorhizobium sp. SB112]|uniref:hypothetical protein n=1 Tax=Mesorhizobium sp. SB112 TaxID=3151853 RepID=UPI0032670AC7
MLDVSESFDGEAFTQISLGSSTDVDGAVVKALRLAKMTAWRLQFDAVEFYGPLQCAIFCRSCPTR